MKNKDYKIIKGWLTFFIVALFISGLTAIPVNSELSFLLKFLSPESKAYLWVQKVAVAYRNVGLQYPFLFYGYDWLAFAHFILAILFIGPWKDPVRNVWVIKFGLIACVLIFPFSFIAGHFRHIPFGWQLIDCSFGLFGLIPLWICHRKITSIT